MVFWDVSFCGIVICRSQIIQLQIKLVTLAPQKVNILVVIVGEGGDEDEGHFH